MGGYATLVRVTHAPAGTPAGALTCALSGGTRNTPSDPARRRPARRQNGRQSALSAASPPTPAPRTTPPIPEYTARQTWDWLRSHTGAGLVDVRCRAEWAFVGVPDLSSLNREVIFAEWPSDGSGESGGGSRGGGDEFVAALTARITALSAADNPPDALAFICRSGQRSRAAARLMTQAGWTCRNVSDGFEGDLNPDRHRGAVNGWKVAGLPWRQS